MFWDLSLVIGFTSDISIPCFYDVIPESAKVSFSEASVGDNAQKSHLIFVSIYSNGAKEDGILYKVCSILYTFKKQVWYNNILLEVCKFFDDR